MQDELAPCAVLSLPTIQLTRGRCAKKRFTIFSMCTEAKGRLRQTQRIVIRVFLLIFCLCISQTARVQVAQSLRSAARAARSSRAAKQHGRN